MGSWLTCATLTGLRSASLSQPVAGIEAPHDYGYGGSHTVEYAASGCELTNEFAIYIRPYAHRGPNALNRSFYSIYAIIGASIM